jgi:hypothetical protein
VGYAAGFVVVTIFGHEIVVVPVLNWRKDRIAWHAVKYGIVPPLHPLEAGGIPRPEHEVEIKNAVRPQLTRNFSFIYGESGVGKTTLVLQAARAVANPANKSLPSTGLFSLLWDRVRELTGLDSWHGGGILYAQIPGDLLPHMTSEAVGEHLAEVFRVDLQSYSWLTKFIGTRGISDGPKSSAAVRFRVSAHTHGSARRGEGSA